MERRLSGNISTRSRSKNIQNPIFLASASSETHFRTKNRKHFSFAPHKNYLQLRMNDTHILYLLAGQVCSWFVYSVNAPRHATPDQWGSFSPKYLLSSSVGVSESKRVQMSTCLVTRRETDRQIDGQRDKKNMRGRREGCSG